LRFKLISSVKNELNWLSDNLHRDDIITTCGLDFPLHIECIQNISWDENRVSTIAPKATPCIYNPPFYFKIADQLALSVYREGRGRGERSMGEKTKEKKEKVIKAT